MKPNKSTGFVWLSILVIQGLLLTITASRLFMTRQSVLGMDECIPCQAVTMIQHEAGLWALVWLLLALASWSIRPLRWFCVAVIWLLIMILIADVTTLQQFSLRLLLADILKFGQQPMFIVEYLQNLLGWLWIPLTLVAVFGLPWMIFFYHSEPAFDHSCETGTIGDVRVVLAGIYLTRQNCTPSAMDLPQPA